MIKFFKVNEPVRIIALLFLMLALHLPILIKGIPVMIPEVKWLTVGEKLASGAMLYRDLWDNIAPLSALTYTFIVALFGKSVLALHIFAFLLTFFQATFFNYITSKHEVFGNKHYLAGLFYIITSGLFLDFFTLSPVLLSMTFLLMALNDIISLFYKTIRDSRIFNIGFFIALAALFYFPAIILIIWLLTVLLLFTKTNLRSVLVIIIGFVFPFLIVWLFFLWFESPNVFPEFYWIENIYISQVIYVSSKDLFLLLAGPLGIVVLGYLILITYPQTHFQSVTKFSMLLLAFFAAITVWLTNERSSFSLILFLPSVAFFAGHYFYLLKIRWMRAILFWLYFSACLFFTFGTLFSNFDAIAYNDLLIKDTQNPVSNKRVLVLGEDVGKYWGNKLATCYINWPIAVNHFGDLSNYENIAGITKQISKDMPEIIIDEKGLMPQLMNRIPLLKYSYLETKQARIYELVKKN